MYSTVLYNTCHENLYDWEAGRLYLSEGIIILTNSAYKTAPLVKKVRIMLKLAITQFDHKEFYMSSFYLDAM